MPDPLRLVVAEDHALIREGLVRILRDLGFDVVGQAGDAPTLEELAAELRPDVIVVDVQMPPTQTDDGLRAAERIRSAQPDVGILVLSQYVEEHYAMELIGEDPRGVGYLLKDRVADVETIGEAVRRVAAGGSALDPEVVARMFGRRRTGDVLAGLTPREREVLALMAEGRSNIGIADVLGVTGAAVEKHVTGIFSKLGLAKEPTEHRRVSAVLTFLRVGG
ncbi:response regulator transcription factor [Patulibacter minatonensis]|uniref:response regulator transcription factor n=1 Tax=Patulibacter minatonensis TaxID=298163 RepID=UPI0004798D31|nr:response regulator transcription factor [Patulibacter minatonensis]